MGDSVVLVEADMHRAVGLHVRPRLRASCGLSTVLIGRDLNESLAEFPRAARRAAASTRALAVLRNGPLPPNPSELLDSDRMRDVLLELHERFDMVIVDSPPLPVLSDALPLINQVDGVLAVSGDRRDDAATGSATSCGSIGLHDGDLLGVVVNFADAQRPLRGRVLPQAARQPPVGRLHPAADRGEEPLVAATGAYWIP